jgi:hypothetical protein
VGFEPTSPVKDAGFQVCPDSLPPFPSVPQGVGCLPLSRDVGDRTFVEVGPVWLTWHTKRHTIRTSVSALPPTKTSMAFRSPRRKHDRDFFHKYWTASTAKTVLSNGTIRWSAPELFNDPFEVPSELTIPFSIPELKEAVEDGMRAAIEGKRETNSASVRMIREGLARFPSAQRQALIRELFRERGPLRPGGDATLDIMRQQWRESVPRTRLFCLSELANQPTMWAYYAQDHTGAVLTFNVVDVVDSPLLLARPIVYTDKPPSMPPVQIWADVLLTGKMPQWEEWFHDYFYCKLPAWSHECEWRVATYARDWETEAFMDRPFHPLELRDVRLGMKMKPEDEAEILRLVETRYPHAHVLRACLDHASRRIEFREVRAPRAA